MTSLYKEKIVHQTIPLSFSDKVTHVLNATIIHHETILIPFINE